MLQIELRALPGSLSFASLPKSVRYSFLSFLRRVVLPVLLHPTRAGCLNCSCESPWYWFLLGNSGLALAARGQNDLPRQYVNHAAKKITARLQRAFPHL